MTVLEVGIIFKQTILDMEVLKKDLKQESFSKKKAEIEKENINMKLCSIFQSSGHSL